MNREVGVWVDHKKALIVFLDGQAVRTRGIESKVEAHVRFAGGARSSGSPAAQSVASEKKREEKSGHHLADYYGEIIKAIGDATVLLILGPGQAKTELKRKIEKSKRHQRMQIHVEPSEKQTDPQIVAKVRAHFAWGRTGSAIRATGRPGVTGRGRQSASVL